MRKTGICLQRRLDAFASCRDRRAVVKRFLASEAARAMGSAATLAASQRALPFVRLMPL
jgi:hypothetical protein